MDRALAIVLEALSARYRPRIMQRVVWPEPMLDNFLRGIDPSEEREFLSAVPHDLLRRQAELLLARAKQDDPLGAWSRVVRMAEPARWGDLRHDALLVHESRVNAELLLRFIEDEAAQGQCEPLPPTSDEWWSPLHERLHISAEDRSETAMDFRLSDRPALHLGLEGQTEITLATKLLALAGNERYTGWIAVSDMKGVNADVRLLARSVAVPIARLRGTRYARLAVPLTALVVATDPEGKHATPAGRESRRLGMVDAVFESLPMELQTSALRRDLEHLIHIRTWPAEFEFAHFSDRVLAQALRRAAPISTPLPVLTRNIAQCRLRGGGFESIWKKWKVQPSKVRLAELLWPDLLRRVQSASNKQSIPLVDLLEEALQIAHRVRWVRELHLAEDD